MGNGDWSFHVNNQLSRDDHPQYVLTNGSRPVTGPLTASQFVDSTDVLVGGLVASAIGPGTATDYSTTATVFTLSVPLVNGHSYQAFLSVANCQQTTNVSTLAQVYMFDSGGMFPIPVRAVVKAFALNEFGGGGNSGVFAATSTGSVVFTVACNSAAASLHMAANVVSLAITRVA